MAHRQSLTPKERHDITQLVNNYCLKANISDSRLAKNAGVDQPMIHHARNGDLKQRTPRLTRLELYIYMANARGDLGGTEPAVHPVIRDVHLAIQDFIAAGGDPMLLSRGIRMLAGTAGSDAAAA